MKKVVITGIGDTRNNGCWAMVTSAMTMMQDLSPVPIQFVILTRKTAQDLKRLKTFNVVFVTRPWTKVSIRKLAFFWNWFCFFILPTQALILRLFKRKSSSNRFWRHCLESDLFLDLSGDSVSADYSIFSLSTIAIPLLIARMLGKPYMFCAQSIGPFSKNVMHAIIVLLLKDASAITTRERYTDKFLSSRSISSMVTPTQDLAFNLSATNPERIRRICEKEGIDAGLAWVGVSISELISSYAFKELSAEEKRAAYMKVMAEFADYIVNVHHKHILFIPHVAIPGISDDRKITHNVYENMKQKDKAILIDGDYLGDELKGLIGLCEAFIGSRMHATIASLSQCIPTLTYAYNHKTLGINGDILKQWEYLIDLREIRGEELLETSKNIFDKLLTNSGEIKEELANRLPAIRSLAGENAQIAVGLLEVAGPLRFMDDPLLCTGCGACAAVCSSGALKLQKTPEGTLRPRVINPCKDCLQCLKVCPVLGINIARHESERFKRKDFDPEIGVVLNSFKGYSCDPFLRKKCSSGGLVTEIAKYLIESNQADAVLVAGDNPEDPLSPRPLWATNVNTLMRSSGSKYTPVPMVEGFKEIPENACRLAVVGLPCHLWGIQTLEKGQYLNNRKVVLRLGLFCGRTPIIDALEFIINKIGCSREDICHVRLRGNGWPGGLCIKTNRKEYYFSHEEVWPFMGSPYFTSKHCYFCPDQFGHLSDISFGDAWLPECKGGNNGWSICLVRSQKGRQLVDTLSELNRIHLEGISIDKVKKAFIGNIRKKYRLKQLKTRLLTNKSRIYTRDSPRMEKSLKKIIGVNFEYLLTRAGKSRVFQEMALGFPQNKFMRANNKINTFLLGK